MSHDTCHDMSVKQSDTNIPLNFQQFFKLFTFKWLQSLADISMLHQTIKSLLLKIVNVFRAGTLRYRTAARRRRQKKICFNKQLYKELVFFYEWYQFNTAREEKMRVFILKQLLI